jgi:hypothetical protein
MMAVSQKFAAIIAEVILKEVGPQKGQRLLDQLVDLAIIHQVPISPKQSIIYIRNQFNLLLVSGRK